MTTTNTHITEAHKQAIIHAIRGESKRLGSQSQVANKAGISPATITNILRADHHHKVHTEMWLRVAASLSVPLQTTWQLCRTTLNYELVHSIVEKTQRLCHFNIISEAAGSGKSSALADIVQQHPQHKIYRMVCSEWGRREFLLHLCQQLGLSLARGYLKIPEIEEAIFSFFGKQAHLRPLLIIDEADKLKPHALRFFISLYNRLEGKMACILSGTQHLRHMLQRGVRLGHKGFDELESRFGRTYKTLIGTRREDFEQIATLNGITDPALQKQIWNKLISERRETIHIPQPESGELTEVSVVVDVRRIKRLIEEYTPLVAPVAF